MTASRHSPLRIAIKLVVLIARWVEWSLRAAACLAFVILIAQAIAPDIVIADAAQRMRWVLSAGAICGAVKILLDRPVPAWLRGE